MLDPGDTCGESFGPVEPILLTSISARLNRMIHRRCHPDLCFSLQKSFNLMKVDRDQTCLVGNYQLALNDVTDFCAGNMFNAITQSYIQMLGNMLSPRKRFVLVVSPIEFTLTLIWMNCWTRGDFILSEAYASLDPNTYTEIYNARLLKKYTTATHSNNQWGMNLLQIPRYSTSEVVCQVNGDLLWRQR